MDKTFLGFSAEVIPVPLFTELYGYGPFLGRRNRGVRDPLFCRVASFRNGAKRVLLIVSDLVTMDPEAAWRIRGELGRLLRIPGDCVLVAGTHTHSGPTVSKGIGWGELDLDFQRGWMETAVRVARQAVADEEAVTAACGRVALAEKLGCNRVVTDGPTDPDIRWARFVTGDGRAKLLIHNHAMHAVVFGPKMLRVSADWPGEASRRIVEQGLAQNAMFLQGAAGDINTQPCCKNEEEGDPILRRIGASYVDSLRRGLESGGAPLELAPLGAVLEPTPMPCDPVTPAMLRAWAEEMRRIQGRPFTIDRMEEMALYLESGGKAEVSLDFQVLRIGGLYVHAAPGEPFFDVGREIMEESPGQMAMVAEVANDNGRYFPTRETFRQNPDIVVPDNARRYGYYEARFAGFGRYRANYREDVGAFVSAKLVSMAKRL
ncbi:MAG TPA: hypothetical protein P5137_02765 [Candidatus Brocadiia bacterium]|nr:hypothetical protein [Candidatus Brocadiia bacterium]